MPVRILYITDCIIKFYELHDLCMLYKLLGIIGWGSSEKSFPLCKCDKGEGIRNELGLDSEGGDSDDNDSESENNDTERRKKSKKEKASTRKEKEKEKRT